MSTSGIVEKTNTTNNTSMYREIPLTPNARRVFTRRYVRRGSDGEPAETPEEAFVRVAHVLAAIDAMYGQKPTIAEQQFLEIMTSLRFLPNAPAFFGAGTPLGQLSACFVLPIADDMGKQSDGIFSTLRAAALIQQTGGGNGFSFSRLRPKGALVKTCGGRATGPVGFLRVYDKAFGEIAQGGVRRGANMAVLRVDHPDVMEFISCKAKEGDISNFNISVAVTDAFMRAVEADAPFDLINPQDKSVWHTLPARQIFGEMVRFAHRNGEPGILFLDTANRYNPVPHLYELEVTNPCGEQWLGPYENCCLGYINLARHVSDSSIDWDMLAETIEIGTRCLDNIIDANKYVPAVPELEAAAKNCRRIGMGITGLADLMYHLGIRYGSPAGEELATQVMEFVRYHTMRISIALAVERGPFPAIKESIYDPAHLQWSPPKPPTPYSRDFSRPALDWDTIVEEIKQHRIRNAGQTNIPPSSFASVTMTTEGYGCEPVFALAYTRHFDDKGEDVELNYTSPLFEQALVNAGLDEHIRKQIIEQVYHTGSCQNVPGIPAHIRDVFVVASDISPEEHVRMQAALQAFADNSIAKTCNFPPDATEEDIQQAYLLAWKLGCKGLTVYVAGSRQKEVLETRKTVQNKTNIYLEPRSRQECLSGKTYRMESPIGTAFITVNNIGGQPYEAFINVGKGGSDIAAISEALGRLCSMILQLPSTWSPTERVKRIIDQLQGIGGRTSLGFGQNRTRSLPDSIAKALQRHLGLTAQSEVTAGQIPLPLNTKADLCPECGQATFIYIEGCRKCYICGFSEC